MMPESPTNWKSHAINLCLGIAGLVLSIFVGFHFKSWWPGMAVGLAWAILGLVVDIRLSMVVPETDSLIQHYARLRSEPCELFSRAAEEKYAETLNFLKGATAGRIEVHSKRGVHDVLSFVLKDLQGLKRIRVTSRGELGEWGEPESWWMKKYVEDHEAAVGRGVAVERIFIISSENDLASGKKAFQINAQLGVKVKAAFERNIEQEDLLDADNCLLFEQEKNQIIYALRASHNKEGEFVKAEIFRDKAQLAQFNQTYARIAKVSFDVPGDAAVAARK
jgi:hypothetical protein